MFRENKLTDCREGDMEARAESKRFVFVNHVYRLRRSSASQQLTKQRRKVTLSQSSSIRK